MKKILISSIILLTFIININLVFAEPADTSIVNTESSQDITDTTPKNSVFPTLNPLKAKDLNSLLLTIVDLAVVIGVIMAVLMFIFIGFKFVMAQGNETKLKQAKEWFLYAVIGTAILISAKLIVSVVQNTLISAGVVDEKLLKK